METNPPRNRPSLELNMSLLGGSPVPPAKTSANEQELLTDDTTPPQQEDPMTTPHEQLLKEAVQWVRELETVRDGLHMLSVRNAILLDNLAIAGATEILSEQEKDDADTDG